MKELKELLKYFLIFFILIQIIQIDKTNPKVDKYIALKADKKVMKILKTSCYDCHSYETKYPSYSYIAPISWLIKRNIINGRKALNFSTYKTIDKDILIARLKRSISQVKSGVMPKPEYVAIHKNAILSKEQKQIYINWAENEIQRLKNGGEKNGKSKRN